VTSARCRTDRAPAVGEGFLVLRDPAPGAARPVLVSIPHYGSEPLPGIGDEHFADPGFRRFPQGYTDAGAAQLYGDLHEAGATVVATRCSRLFVDVNRRRGDFETAGPEVRSRRGVVRTHISDDRAIFARPLGRDELERRLRAVYDPYHHALDRAAERLLRRHGRGVVLDAHTASEKGMGEHEVVIGTRRGATAGEPLREAVAATFGEHGFDVQHDLPGYAGAHIVQRFAGDHTSPLQAVQIEVNSRLLIRGSRREYFAHIDSGRPAPMNRHNLERLRRCMRAVVDRVGQALQPAAG
jgi:N-formylglutamate amidohydrolase